jgi:hypothetical protein
MAEESAEQFYPLTAREALLAIRMKVAEFPVSSDFLSHIDHIAAEGLGRRAMGDFTLTDQLADRLAEAHEVLQKLVDTAPESPEQRDLVGSAAEALSLPPDLEAMVERRIGG